MTGVTIRLDGGRTTFQPGETLAGDYRLEKPGNVRLVKVSVCWRTEGKGDEDTGEHHTETHPGGSSGRFTTMLPHSPLSYAGIVVSLVWLVRVRMWFQDGKEVVGELPFFLGDVQPGQEVDL